MAPPSIPIATSKSHKRRGGARPPLSQEVVAAHPELCYAPRLMPVPLPSVSHHTTRPHTYPTTVYVPDPSRRANYGGGDASHYVPGAHAQVAAPTPNTSHVYYYPSSYAPPHSMASPHFNGPPAYSPTNTVPFTQSTPVPVPKARYPSQPPTPDSTPPRPAVASRPKRTSTDAAQHGASPTT